MVIQFLHFSMFNHLPPVIQQLEWQRSERSGQWTRGFMTLGSFPHPDEGLGRDSRAKKCDNSGGDWVGGGGKSNMKL